MSKKKQTKKQLPQTVLEGRAVGRGLESIYRSIKETSSDVKSALIQGAEPLEAVLDVLDSLDFLALQCTVPCVVLHKELYARVDIDEKSDTTEREALLGYIVSAESEEVTENENG